MITVGELVEWIVRNKRGKSFNYEPEIIQREVCHAIANGVFVYKEVDGEIQGVTCGERDERSQCVHIWDILATKPGVVKEFMARFILIYPDWKITGRRHGKDRVYDDPKQLAERL
jgi:hypothetical protein